MDVPTLIRARGLTKAYAEAGRRHEVLRGADLDIGAGEFVVVLGRSGSGKSTLLNLLGAMDVPTDGELSIDGQPVGRLDELARTLFRRRRVGFVFQAYNLIPTLTVAENLRLPLALNGREEDARERVESQLDALGLAGKAGRFPDQLSGGEQQRVAVARALIHEPALVIADEPTGNLDLETGRQVLDLLDRMTRVAGKTLVMATHSREVVGMADRVLMIEDGRLTEAGGT
jgi:putative ABC transport system ATP-binding protein